MTFNPTPEQIEAAAEAIRKVECRSALISDVDLSTYKARAALVAAAGAVPQEPAAGDQGELIAEAGKHSKGEPQHCDCGRPGCDGQAYCTWCGNEWPCLSRRLADALAAPPQVDEAKLAEAIADELETDDAVAENWSSGKLNATARRLVQHAVLPVLRGEDR